MYCTPTETRKARTNHQCTNCAEYIVIGESYKRWMSIDDNKAYINKMHEECLLSLINESYNGTFEYSLFCGERPKIV